VIHFIQRVNAPREFAAYRISIEQSERTLKAIAAARLKHLKIFLRDNVAQANRTIGPVLCF
jgi:hypothetical protein